MGARTNIAAVTVILFKKDCLDVERAFSLRGFSKRETVMKKLLDLIGPDI